MRFVKALCDRRTRPAAELEPQAEESRTDTLNRAMAAGEQANTGNPWLTSTKRRDKLRRQLGY
jgi:hypothetical protein